MPTNTMSSFFRKAISLFVILEEEEPQKAPAKPASGPSEPVAQPASKSAAVPDTPPVLSKSDLSKFEQHFQQLFEQANLPGPDYYEFWKTMDTLEAHIPDEKARIQAVFASLRIQGLTKQILIESAGKYREVILQDKANFESAVQKKSEAEIAGRKAMMEQLAREREEKLRMIEQLQQDLENGARKMEGLQEEIAAEQAKIEQATHGYLAACTAMVSKIDGDVGRFQQIVE